MKNKITNAQALEVANELWPSTPRQQQQTQQQNPQALEVANDPTPRQQQQQQQQQQMTHAQALEVGRELWPSTPVRRQRKSRRGPGTRRAEGAAPLRRCKAGSRKRVCKVNGETVTDCFNPCSASPADSRKDEQIKKLQSELRGKDAEKRADLQKQLLEQKKKYIAALKDKDADIESIKKRTTKTLKILKHKKHDVEKEIDILKTKIKENDEFNDDVSLKRELEECEKKLKMCLSQNEGLHEQNQQLLNLAKQKKANPRPAPSAAAAAAAAVAPYPYAPIRRPAPSAAAAAAAAASVAPAQRTQQDYKNYFKKLMKPKTSKKKQ